MHTELDPAAEISVIFYYNHCIQDWSTLPPNIAIPPKQIFKKGVKIYLTSTTLNQEMSDFVV